ncbi:32 kDa beta-galactoside-binding lectin-like [Helicoverpa armigera]|uniref:32 kDa beta-galactoside-binding lectin-like n=1 Tax=Helicoverpa armigera TaxID=29058 RepID=UPI0030835A1E
MISIYDPDLPCVHKIAVDITNDSKIRIQGSLPHDAHRFWIDLKCGDDVAFHISRFDEMEIVRNTYSAGIWGEEERSGGMPLCRGDNFDMLIASDEESFRVSINGQHFCEYIHRIEYDRITHLVVFGDVKIIRCNIVAPSQDPYGQNMQCVHKIPGGICSSNKIRIQGSIPHDAHRFTINLKCGADVAFHINPRFDEMEIVRNTYSAGFWGKEERSGGMPLRRGGNFDMLIASDDESFRVAINGQHFCEFVHRIGFVHIDHLVVYGDVNIKLISL